MDDAIFAYWSKAPGHLGHVAVPAAEDQIRTAQEQYGAFSTVFAIRMPAGTGIYQYYDEEEETGGKVWAAFPDGQELILHDPLEHGYEGQLGISYGDGGSGSKRQLLPPAALPLELVLCFQYNGDEAELLEDGNSEAIQDYYSWLAIYQANNAGLQEIINLECA